MVYFRLKVADHDEIALAALADPWIRMPKVAEMRSVGAHGGD
jgi:hypothetical protein